MRRVLYDSQRFWSKEFTLLFHYQMSLNRHIFLFYENNLWSHPRHWINWLKTQWVRYWTASYDNSKKTKYIILWVETLQRRSLSFRNIMNSVAQNIVAIFNRKHVIMSLLSDPVAFNSLKKSKVILSCPLWEVSTGLENRAKEILQVS